MSFKPTDPLISIIIPVFNVEKYINRCLLSICNQTFENWEAIFVDDGSIDSSYSILQSYATHDSRIKLYQTTNNGQGVARNFGIEVSSGKYLVFVDADDYIEPNLCEVALELMEKSGCDFCNYGFDFVQESNLKHKNVRRYKIGICQGSDILRRAMLDDQILSIAWNKIYKREFLNFYNIRFPALRANEDLFFSRKVSKYARSTVFSNRILYHALIRSGSTSRSASISLFESTKKLLDEERREFTGQSYVSDQIFNAHAIKLYSYLLVQCAFRICDYDEYHECYLFFKHSDCFLYIDDYSVVSKLSCKNRLLVFLCTKPRLLRFLANVLKIVRISPY